MWNLMLRATQRISVLVIGAVFALFGSITVAVSAPHIAVIPIVGGIVAILGGIGAMLNRKWSPYLMYVVAVVYGIAFARNVWEMFEADWFGASRPGITITLLSGALFVLAIGLGGYIVSLCIKDRTGAT